MGRLFWSLMGAVAVVLVVMSCGSSGSMNNGSGTTGSGGAGGTTTSSTASMGGSTPEAGPPEAGPDTAADAPMMCTVTDQPFGAAAIAAASCSSPPPAGAPMPSPVKKYTGGTCPTLVAYDGTATNTITTMGNMRQFLLAVPNNLQPNEVLPVIFLWHWLGGSPQDFYNTGDVQNAVNTQRFLAVIPFKKGDVLYTWPFSILDSQARMDEEFTFFDDMLACVAGQFNINASCVSTAGVSAGALFTDQLAGNRSDYLSSFLSLSGGVSDNFIKPWTTPVHPLPGFVLWGGPNDTCIVINFQQASQALEQSMTADCEFMVECIHNCGHGVPPFDFDAGPSDFAGLWQFALDHPYWLPAGTSPYTTKGLPTDLPAWCGIGPGSATPRTGPCNPPGC